MNLLGKFLSSSAVPIFFYTLLVVAIFSLFFPRLILKFRTRKPRLYIAISGILITIAVLFQFPVLFGGMWGLVKYVETDLWPIIKVAKVFLILLYPAIFFVSLFTQSRKNNENIAFGIATFTSLILSPILFFTFVWILDKLFLKT